MASSTPPVSAAHIPALDGLRGCAVLAVLMLHFADALPEPSGAAGRVLKHAFHFGWAGVDLFFVLSGFLITGILADTRDRADRYRSFYARRALRILPLYFGFVALLFAVPWLAGARAYATPVEQQLPYWLFLQNLSPLRTEAIRFCAHLWSLAIEEQFYLVWPLVIFFLSPARALRVCCVLMAGALVYRVAGVLMADDLRSVYFQTPGRIDGLAVGGALALMIRGAREGRGLAALRRRAPLAGVLALCVIAGAAATPAGFNPAGPYMLVAGYSALALLFGAVLVMAVAPEGWGGVRLLETGGLRFLGRYSYGLYMLHVPVIAAAYLAGVSPARFRGTAWELPAMFGFVSMLMAASVLAAMASFHLYEQPFLRLRSRYPRPREAEETRAMTAP
ncbi:MAG TPA: acyltransferase [Longimicrobium sp.]|jgi:peptidoglycan/LPS O-acetylase OafA/YrhL|uniref:acyltransferase family protein n=1 Tax=Longimicrobium sp. TaxID=2029185 RepID=UPI002EDB85FB